MGDVNNQDEQAKQIILSLFNLNEKECEIKRQGVFYAIQPANGKQQLDIDVRVANIDIFNQYHLIFENCMFKRELFFDNQTFLHQIEFKNCTFLDVHFSGATFKEEVKFCDSTFKKKGANFFEATFEKCVDFSGATLQYVRFPHVTFKKGANFSGTTFRKWVDFRVAIFEKKTDFSGAKFEEEADISDMELEESEKFSIELQKGELFFSNATFKEELFFSNATFKVDVYFNNAKFQKVDFSDANFLHKAEFQGSHFNEQALFSHATFQQVSFRGSIFDSNAYFFEAKFHTIPDFLQVNFNKNINFTNTELDFGFDEAREKIKETYTKRKKEYDSKQNKGCKEEPKEYKIANEFRDSFRNFKAALIEHHNMLDASNHHRIELYFKELELEYRNSGLRDFIDKIQLYCYRITSDHHTNLLLILTNVLALIVFFGCATTALFCRANDLQKKIRVGRECCEAEQSYYLLTTFPEHIIDYIFPKNIAVWGEILAIIVLCIMFIDIFIFIVHCIHKIDADKLHCYFKLLCILTLIILAVKPAIILPVFGKLIDEGLKVDFPAFTSLSIVYAILMFLFIWSLQKTARKNTIVPN